MFRRRLVLLIIVVLLLSSSIVQASSNIIDKSLLKSGLIKVNYEVKKDIRTVVRVTKGKINYDYFLNKNNNFPLQLGDGEYTVSILENVEGNKYRQVQKEALTLKATNENDVYLQSIQMINWNKDMKAIKKAKELTKGLKSHEKKIKAIYDYIVNNVKYDRVKARKVTSGYLPSIEDTLQSSMGICFDYSALFAAMLRSEGIPTKLIMGYKDDIKEYHAWNQVYIEDTDEWLTIDTTYDAGLKDGKTKVSMVKDTKEYKIEKEY